MVKVANALKKRKPIPRKSLVKRDRFKRGLKRNQSELEIALYHT